MSNWRHSKKAKQTSSQTFLPLSPSPNPVPHAHFGSKASFLRCDLQTLNYSRSYRKRRRKKRKESFAQRPNERTGERSCRSINGNIHTAVTDNRGERGRGQDRHARHVHFACTFSRGCAGHQPKFHATFLKPLAARSARTCSLMLWIEICAGAACSTQKR